jgi:hypothetical protein
MGREIHSGSDTYMITEITITLGKTIPHPTLNYASLRADISLSGRSEAGIEEADILCLRAKALQELDATLDLLIREAKSLPGVASKRGNV